MKNLSFIILLFAFGSLLELNSQTKNENWPLLASFPFDGNALDISGNENHGIVGENTKLTIDRFGRADHAYLFDGETSYIRVNPQNISDSIYDFSLSFWYKLNGFIDNKANYPRRNNSDLQYLLDLHTPNEIGTNNLFADGPTFTLEYKKDQKSYFHYTICKDSVSNLYSYPLYETYETPIDTNTWYHIVYQKKGDSTYIYLNKELVTVAVSDRRELKLDFNHPWYFGNSGAGLFSGYRPEMNFSFNGVLDDINIYEKALSEEEIKELFYDEKCMDIVYETITIIDTVHITVYDTIPDHNYESTLVQVYDTIHITVYDTVSVTDTLIIELNVNVLGQEQTALIKVYPNPSKDYIIVESEVFAEFQNKTIWIADLLGKMIHSEQIKDVKTRIDISSFAASGTYVLMIVDENLNILQKRKIVVR